MKNKILVTGSNGQLGSELQSISANYENCEFVFTDVAELDITNETAVEEFVKENNFTHILNCAAYTAVDKAESDIELATKINSDAVKNLANSANIVGAILIHISTDFIFDGTKSNPYIEDDKACPINIYGETKLAGEAQAKLAKKGAIIRTAWVYSSFGNNFVKSMRNLGSQRDELGVIFDQIGTPTYARDLAVVMMTIVEKGVKDGVETYHYSNEGIASWYDFAKMVMKLSNIDCFVKPIETVEYPTPAKRPHYSVMNKKKIKEAFDIKIPHWAESLADCIEIL